MSTLSRAPSSAAGTAVAFDAPEDGPGSEKSGSLVAAACPVVPINPAGAEELAAAEPWGSSLGLEAAVAVIRQQHVSDTTKHNAVRQET